MSRTKKCRLSAKRLSLYLDGQCSEKQKLYVEDHLSWCRSCQQELILLRASRLIFKSFPSIKLPSTLDKNFIKKLREEKPALEQ